MTSRRVAYMTGEYPRATDTFIQREVKALRQTGVHVETISVRRPKLGEFVGVEQEEESRRTCYLLPCSPLRIVRRTFSGSCPTTCDRSLAATVTPS